jgi:phage replication-related protein YjqB (UPF0714/DUF867 family)
MYPSYEKLRYHEEEGRDYIIIAQPRGDTAIIAIHGGRIEPGTHEIAEAIAGNKFGLYAFRGVKPTGNAGLRIASTGFEEPRLNDMLASTRRVLSIHGWAAGGETILMGGRDRPLQASIAHALASAGFTIQRHSRPELQGCHPKNVCNRGLTGKGVQMEISWGLRRHLLLSPTTLLTGFVAAVRQGFGSYPKDECD